jgi:carbonic anhydrase
MKKGSFRSGVTKKRNKGRVLSGQYLAAVLLSCIDSRAPAEQGTAALGHLHRQSAGRGIPILECHPSALSWG